jgi:hypothetical protein
MDNQLDDISGGSTSSAGEDSNRKMSADGPTPVPRVKLPLAVPPTGVAQLFDNPPLVGDEKREDYDKFFLAIAAAVNPVDEIAWMFTWDIAYLSWEIRRERIVKANIVRSSQIDAVRNSLEAVEAGKPMRIIRGKTARQWASNPKSRREIDKRLADDGYGQSDILAQAYILGAANIDAIDRRIASYELRRMALVREVEAYNGKFARKLDAASKDVVDAEFTDAPQENS